MVYRLGSLGDTVVALPCFHLIARAFPNAERRLLTNIPVSDKVPVSAAVLGESGLIHGYLRYAVGERDVLTLLRLRAAIRAFRPEILIYLAAARGGNSLRRDALFFRLCGIRQIIGLPDTPELAECRWDPETDTIEAEASRLARCIVSLGSAQIDLASSWDLRLTQDEMQTAREVLAPAADRPIFAVSVGTKVQAKDWGVENWRSFLDRLAPLYPEHSLVLIGAAAESSASRHAAASWQGRSLDLCGQLTARESAAVMGRAMLFIGHDSGPMHLAAAAGTSCIAIFAARNLPVQWFPYAPAQSGAKHRVIYHRVDCRGCGLETCIVQQKKCLTSITVDEVLEKVAEAVPLASHATVRFTIGS